MLIEAMHLANIYVAQAMLDWLDMGNVLGNTTHGDGTTKYHRHYQTFQVTTQSGQSLSAGLLELGSQDAESLLQAWKERVAAIATALASGTDQNTVNHTVDKLISSVKNTVSDQCATNGVFNRLLQSLREEVMPRVVDGWDGFDKDKKEKLSEMGNFFCMLHPLLTFAEEANKALIHFENACLEGTHFSRFVLPVAGESGSVRTVRTILKVLGSKVNLFRWWATDSMFCSSMQQQPTTTKIICRNLSKAMLPLLIAFHKQSQRTLETTFIWLV